MSEEVFLKPEVTLEPLVCGWYAWTHLVSPAQHALNVLYRHIPLLQSFLRSPAVHTAAARDPAMFGGPFLSLREEDTSAVRELLAATERRCAKLIKFARDLRELDRRLQQEASGYSLSQFYRDVPESVAGLVEFLYELNHHPQLRVQEELMYDEGLAAGTQEMMLSMTDAADRAFFMSTPRLPSADAMILPLSFADPRIDELAALRTKSAPLASVAAILGSSSATARQFLTTTPPARDTPAIDSGVRIRYFGHACVLLQTQDVTILIDPMFAWGNGRDFSRYTFCDLPDRIDYVVLSHNHQDHCSPEMLLQIRSRVGTVLIPPNNRGALADPSMKLMLKHLGFERIQELTPFEQVAFSAGRIVSLPFPGEHVDLNIHSRQGIYLEVNGRHLAFLVDSDGCDRMLFQRVARRIGVTLDAMFIGMECHGAPLTWLYGPLLTLPITRKNDESRRLSGLDSERAWRVVQQLPAKNVFVYAMGQEPWLRYIMGLQYSPDSIQLREVTAFLERCREGQVNAEHLFMKRELNF